MIINEENYIWHTLKQINIPGFINSDTLMYKNEMNKLQMDFCESNDNICFKDYPLLGEIYIIPNELLKEFNNLKYGQCSLFSKKEGVNKERPITITNQQKVKFSYVWQKK